MYTDVLTHYFENLAQKHIGSFDLKKHFVLKELHYGFFFIGCV